MMLAFGANHATAATHSPSGCNANALNVNIAVNPQGNILLGTTVHYTINIQNFPTDQSGNPACDVLLGTAGLVFTCPGADGHATGTSSTLIAGGVTIAAGSPVQTFHVDCVVSATYINDPAVGPQADAHINAPGAILQNGFNSPANIDKFIAVNVVHPCINVTKNCATDCTPYGMPISFSGFVTNCGDVNLNNITLSDNPAATITFATTTVLGNPFSADTANANNFLGGALAGSSVPGDAVAYTGSYIPSGATLCGPFSDTITASGTAPDVLPTPATVTATASATCHVSTSPAITLVKDCGKFVNGAVDTTTKTINPGDQYGDVFTVKNTGNVPLTGIVITDSLHGTTSVPDLAPGGVSTITAGPYTSTSSPASAADCVITDTATITANSICPADATCNSPLTASAGPTPPCTINLNCAPHIEITKQVACFLPGNTCGTYGPTATGVKDDKCPSFCWQITITSDGSVPVGSIDFKDVATPDDPALSGITAAAFAPFPIAVGDSRTVTITNNALCVNTLNTVTATAYSGSTAGTGTTGNTVTASANAVIVQIGVACTTIITSDMNLEMPPVANHVILPAGSVNAPITVTFCITNTGSTDEIVTAVSGLPPLVLCSDDTTPVDPNLILGLPLTLPSGQSVCAALGCWLVSCSGNTGGSFSPGVTVIADTNIVGLCVWDTNGVVISTSISGTCPASVSCLVPTSCRTTGGGTMYNCDTSVDCVTVTTVLRPSSINVSGKTLTLDHVSHGGQLGAPYSQPDCAQILADQCIRGEWQHNRHYSGPNNPADVYAADFHTAGTNAASHPIFDTLLCECLGCCSADGTKIPAVIGSLAHNGKFFLCNPDDHKVCGPMPRPAPDNALIWSGLATLTPANTIAGNQKTANYAVVRVYVEDRSEPGGFHPKGSVMPADVYVFQAWDTGIPVTKKNVDPNNLPKTGPLGDINVFRSTLSQDSCTFIQSIGIDGPCPAGSLPSDTILGIRASVSDAGSLHSGNQQIHPSTGATCPGPGGIPAPAPGTPNTSACVNPTNCTNP
jgi:hypothetical protein